MEKKKNKIRRWFGKKFQLVLYHSVSYDIVRKMKFNRLGLISFVFSVFLVFFAIISALVIFTELKKFIPGYPDKETRTLIYENAIRTDSLLNELEIRDQYMGFLRDAIFNDIPIDEDYVLPITNLTQEQIDEFNDPRTLRRQEKREVKQQKLISTQSVSLPYFFPPVKGITTSPFNPAIKHYGTDIAAVSETIIKATYAGTVIISNFTVETGYTLVIQHQGNIISVYRHLKSLLVEAGDFVETGQAIAVYGDTGELSSGKHLHFELWKDGVALDPEVYINFQ